ncbi:seed maturation protein [Actinidia rufa]|uniref:Seed maturation protein n=1 Tax=Actinidia rufa TaxID=165716 RepID=A0A7J0FJD1_9ERIC|nr:seed maturation protein [Actinidia rufa]
MSQKQPQWSKTEEEAINIKYGDVFSVSGDLASKHIAPQDAVTMQAAENMTLGKNPKGSPAAVRGREIMGQYTAPATGQGRAQEPAIRDAFTIGDALEATALSAGDKPVNQSDAAAIQAAEMKASGTNEIAPGGVGATAQSEVTRNVRAMRDEDKTKLSVVLEDASAKLPSDKVATREDAEGVIGAEMRNNPRMATCPGGVADSMAAAAGLDMK